MSNTENEIIFTPLNLHIVACVNIRTPLSKTNTIKRKESYFILMPGKASVTFISPVDASFDFSV